MTVLLLALFGLAALLACSSLAVTIRNHAQAALDIERQLEACRNPNSPTQSKSWIHRRHKSRLAKRTAAPRGISPRGLRRDCMVSTQQIGAVHKVARRRQFGQSLLSPARPVFE
jgi:hypothetical protein